MVNEEMEDLHGPRYITDASGKKILLIRKSMVEDYISCPWKFKRIWIDGVKKVPNQDMLVGTRYHDFMEKFFKKLLPIDYWDDMIPEGYYLPIEEDWIRWTIRMEKERYYDLVSKGRQDEFLPIKTEFKMVSPRLYLESTVDRAEWYDQEKGYVCLVEYKTGASENWQSVKRQLALYAILWEDVVKLGKVTHMKLVNPNSKTYKIINLDPWEKDHVYKTIGNIRKALKDGIYKHTCNEIIYAYCMLCTPGETGMYPDDDGLTCVEYLEKRRAECLMTS